MDAKIIDRIALVIDQIVQQMSRECIRVDHLQPVVGFVGFLFANS
jgi:hypothetical protein